MTSNNTAGADAGTDAAAHTSLGLSLLMLLTLGILWGGITAMAKFVTMAGVPALGYAFWQTSGAGIILLLVCLARGKPPPMGRAHLRHYLIVGALGSAIPTANLFYALANLPTGIVALVITTGPLFAYLLSLFVRLEGFDWRRAAGIGLGFVAILMIAVPDASLPDRAMVPWALFALIAPLSYSAENVYLAIRRPSRSSPFVLLCGMMIAGSLILLPVVWVSDGWAGRFGLPEERNGNGDTPEQVAAFRAERALLEGYAEAAHDAALRRMRAATPEQLKRTISSPGRPDRPAYRSLLTNAIDYTEHTGQIAYLRGMITGPGWL